MNVFEFEEVINKLRANIEQEKDLNRIFDYSKEAIYRTNLGFEEQCVIESVAEIMEERRKGVA